MVGEKLFHENPTLYAFLPLFYMVWADAVLTPSEINRVQKLLEKQQWLTGDERNLLMSFLDPVSPPSPTELKKWLKEIRKTSDYLSADMKSSLVEIGIKLAQINSRSGTEETLDNARKPLQDIEQALGIVSRESAYHFNALVDRKSTMEVEESTINIDEINKILDDEDAEIIRKVKTLVQDPVFEYYKGESIQEYREQVLVWCKYLAQQGYGAIAYPKKYGGGEDMKKYFVIMESLAYHDLSMVIKFGVQFGLWGMSVMFLGTEKHHKKYLQDIGTLKLPGCFAMTETGHGSNVKGIRTTATYDHQSKTITIHTPSKEDGKEYIGNAALHGRMATVFAKLIIDDTDYGVNAFIVPLRDEKGKLEKGVTIEDCGHKMGLNGVDNGKIFFDKVKIPLENMLDRFGSISKEGEFTSPIASDNRRFFTMLGTLVGGRIGVPRAGLSAAKSGLTIAIRYGNQRRQFGPEGGEETAILNYRTHQRRLMPLLANAYAIHFALGYVTQRFLERTDQDIQEIEALAAGIKAYATWNTTHTLQECREACGGKGYLSENRIDTLKADTDIFTTFEGDNTVLMQLVAKSRLSEFKQEFSDINLFGIINYLTDQAKITLTEMNPIIIRSTDEEHLLDSEFHMNAFRYRERDILSSAAKRLKHHIDQGMDSFDAFNQCQYHLFNVGVAYIEAVIMEQFILKVNSVEDGSSKNILKKLCDLYALSTIEKNKGWYLEHDYMEGAKTKAIRRVVNNLVKEIRQEAVPLVNAFKIPESCLAAPIILNH
ncbi:MAG: acyl-CoA dehydrogenase [Bacteroidota bacterium]